MSFNKELNPASSKIDSQKSKFLYQLLQVTALVLPLATALFLVPKLILADAVPFARTIGAFCYILVALAIWIVTAIVFSSDRLAAIKEIISQTILITLSSL